MYCMVFTRSGWDARTRPKRPNETRSKLEQIRDAEGVLVMEGDEFRVKKDRHGAADRILGLRAAQRFIAERTS